MLRPLRAWKIVETVQPPKSVSAQPGIVEPHLRPLPTGTSHVAFATTRCFTTFGSGPRSLVGAHGL